MSILILAACFWASRAAGAEDIRDIKPPVEFPGYPLAVLFFVAAVLLAAAAYISCRYYKRRIPMKEKVTVKTPWEKAYERLEALAHSDLPARGAWEQYYLTLSDIVRRYFEERFQIRAPEMTSEEFLISLQNFAGLAQPSKAVLTEFLSLCDMVKFAKFSPDAAQAQKNIALARRLIDETKN